MPPSRTLHKKRPRRTPPPARRVGKATEAETRLLALEERLIRAPARGAAAADPATRAWLLLAAAESIAHEPPAAVADRLRALLELTGQAPTPV